MKIKISGKVFLLKKNWREDVKNIPQEKKSVSKNNDKIPIRLNKLNNLCVKTTRFVRLHFWIHFRWYFFSISENEIYIGDRHELSARKIFPFELWAFRTFFAFVFKFQLNSSFYIEKCFFFVQWINVASLKIFYKGNNSWKI